jgi:hypothetical protein
MGARGGRRLVRNGSIAVGGVLVSLLLAGCGSSAQGRPPAAGSAAAPPVAHPARSRTGAAPRFRATLSAATHTPKANANWHYVVRVTSLDGRPLRASVHLQVLFEGAPVGQIGRHTVTGVWQETIQWPPASVGHPLVFQAVVHALGTSRKLDWPVRVH